MIKIIQIKKKNKKPIGISQIKIGTKRSFKIKITKKIHNQFKNFSGDKSPIHVSKKISKTNNFKNIIGYAFLLTAALSQIFGMHFPGGNELCLHQTCNFRKPFFINDILIFNLKVVQVNKPRKLLTIQINIFNQHGQLIFDGSTILQLALKV